MIPEGLLSALGEGGVKKNERKPTLLLDNYYTPKYFILK